jgi:hypothetical protein
VRLNGSPFRKSQSEFVQATPGWAESREAVVGESGDVEEVDLVDVNTCDFPCELD